MKKWYNVELSYMTREAIRRAENFREWLYDNDVKHEISSAGDMVHFEILATADDLPKINNALDSIVWYDAI